MQKLASGLTLILLSGYMHAEPLLNEPIKPIPIPQISSIKQVELGRLLFHEVRLSKNNQLSCASCHSLKYGGADGQVVSSGVNGSKGLINSPSIFNSSLNFRQFWDGRAADLLQQIDGPLSNPIEMNSTWPEVLSKLKQDPFYREQFNNAFRTGLTISNIKAAIVSFEESLLTPNSRFDLYLKNQNNAISAEELEGYRLFKQYGCISCHQGVAVGANLYQRFGLMGDYFADRGNISAADLGRFQLTGKEVDRYVFKVPSLRNVALTAPYFHDGSSKDLSDAVAVMMRYQLGIVAQQQEIDKIILFLNTLTGQYQNAPL